MGRGPTKPHRSQIEDRVGIGDRVGRNRKSSFNCQAKRKTQKASASKTVPTPPFGGGSEESDTV